MKRSILIVLAMLLFFPCVSFAGSATSRWDLTVGGYVKFDVGWADQLVGADYSKPYKDSTKGTRNNLVAEKDNLYWAGGETRLNFAIVGPEGLGAKTSAFIEGDFRGAAGSGDGTYKNGSTNNYTLFTMRHAYMQMIWPKTTLLLGHTWQAWGVNPNLNVLGMNEDHILKGWIRVPQIRVTQKLSKEFTVQAAVASGSTTQLTSGGTNYYNESTSSVVPHFSTEVIYASDVLGKVGPFGLKLGLGGFAGKDRFYYTTQEGNSFSSDAVTTYALDFYWNVPILCSKQDDKKGGLTLSGNAFMGRGLGLYGPFYTGALNGNGAYNRANGDATVGSTSINPAARYDIQEPISYGGWTQATYYFTDKLFMNGTYGFQRNILSNKYTKKNVDSLGYIDTYIVSLMYDVNPAMRFGLEYTRVRAQYGWYSTTTTTVEDVTTTTITKDRDGCLNSLRFGAYYFF